MSEEKTMIIKESELKKLISEIEALKKAVHGPATIKPEETKHRTLKIRFIDGKPIVGLFNKGTERYPVYTYETPDPFDPKTNRLCLGLKLLGEDKPVEIDYKALAYETEEHIVNIIEIKPMPWVEKQGEVEVTKVEWDKHATTSTGETTQAEVRGKKCIYVVEDPYNTGKTLEIDETVVNLF